MTLLVNDGDCERKNRRVLFDPRFTEGGIGRIELGHLLCGVYLLTTSVDTI